MWAPLQKLRQWVCEQMLEKEWLAEKEQLVETEQSTEQLIEE